MSIVMRSGRPFIKAQRRLLVSTLHYEFFPLFYIIFFSLARSLGRVCACVGVFFISQTRTNVFEKAHRRGIFLVFVHIVIVFSLLFLVFSLCYSFYFFFLDSFSLLILYLGFWRRRYGLRKGVSGRDGSEGGAIVLKCDIYYDVFGLEGYLILYDDMRRYENILYVVFIFHFFFTPIGQNSRK